MIDLARANSALEKSIASIMGDPNAVDRQSLIRKSVAEYVEHVAGLDIGADPVPVAKGINAQERSSLTNLLHNIAAHNAGLRAEGSDIVRVAKARAAAAVGEIEISKASVSPLMRAVLARRSAA